MMRQQRQRLLQQDRCLLLPCVLLMLLCTTNPAVAADAGQGGSGPTRPRIVTDDGNNLRIESARSIFLEPHWNGTVYLGDIDLISTMREQQVRMRALEALVAPPSVVCQGNRVEHLNCDSQASRDAVLGIGACEAETVVHCCCDAFYQLTHVSGAVYIDPNAKTVSFGNMVSIGGGILSSRGSFTSIEFGALQEIPGPLILSSDALQTLNLGSVSRVSTVSLLHRNLTSLNLGELSRVDGQFLLNSVALESVDLGKLQAVGSDLTLHSDAMLSINFSQLVSVGGSLRVSRNKLQSLHLPLTMNAIGLDLDASENYLSSIDFGSLTSVGRNVDLAKNALTAVHFNSLTSIGGHLDLANNAITQLALTQSLSIGGGLFLKGNPLSALDCSDINVECVDIDDGVMTTNCPGSCFLTLE
ncbi:hypothetical protein PTSG_10810 [Salpingoeca rosetta]|uniref:Receptor L-domain domain-containing protein n=1 Tax=Salpingoeca rosetta (strain ATCC 50818 / BSB-021) TaxID=946362 RepID=F2UPZ7_SALR5|nr:uncharacterized protein PTSG_10810 [Salpingoeca rosetta]EGD79827.1 hypothetical protein PTSG_10810 [Salpingoeca rosetta]|eukprot:XP_004988775.1 hypothetical protein PTSG_10810 [Salpingoeca rosetta]